jgi:serine/threonine protein kinase
VILYEILTGRVPFDAGNAMDTAILHITQPPPSLLSFNPAISPQVEAVILKALEKKPGDRYRTCLEMAIALEAARQQTMAAADSVPSGPRSGNTGKGLSLAEYALKATVALPTVAARVPRKAEIAQARTAETIASPATVARRGASLGKLLAWVIFIIFMLSVAVLVWWYFYG